jgi:Sec-independent protein secretion pathway component TatC
MILLYEVSIVLSALVENKRGQAAPKTGKEG